jgi:hypothetical protein
MTMIKIIRKRDDDMDDDDDYDIGISSYDRRKIKNFISDLSELEYNHFLSGLASSYDSNPIGEGYVQELFGTIKGKTSRDPKVYTLIDDEIIVIDEYEKRLLDFKLEVIGLFTSLCKQEDVINSLCLTDEEEEEEEIE